MSESCHIWMSYVTHINESCHTYEWVMSHIWMSHVIHIDIHNSIGHVTHFVETYKRDLHKSKETYKRDLHILKEFLELHKPLLEKSSYLRSHEVSCWVTNSYESRTMYVSHKPLLEKSSHLRSHYVSCWVANSYESRTMYVSHQLCIWATFKSFVNIHESLRSHVTRMNESCLTYEWVT